MDSPLSIYLNEAARSPLLSVEDEARLGRLSLAGDEAARSELVRHNLRLVVSIARKYWGRGIDIEDLIAEGNVGLMRAARTYDPDHGEGIRFSTYATWWVMQAVRRLLATKSCEIQLPSHVADISRRYRKARVELGPEATKDAVAAHAGLTPGQARQYRAVRKVRSGIRRDQDVERAGDERGLMGQIADGSTGNPLESLAGREDSDRLHAALGKINPRLATILRRRYPADASEARTLTEVGEELGITRERVRQLEVKAIDKVTRWMQRMRKGRDWQVGTGDGKSKEKAMGRPRKHDYDLIADIWREVEHPSAAKVAEAYHDRTGESVQWSTVDKLRPDDVPVAGNRGGARTATTVVGSVSPALNGSNGAGRGHAVEPSPAGGAAGGRFPALRSFLNRGSGRGPSVEADPDEDDSEIEEPESGVESESEPEPEPEEVAASIKPPPEPEPFPSVRPMPTPSPSPQVVPAMVPVPTIPPKGPLVAPVASPDLGPVLAELDALRAMVAILGPLDAKSRARVVRWLADRFGEGLS